MTANRAAGWRVDLSLVFVALIWGATFVLVKRALDDISTLLFLTLRFIFAVSALSLIFRKELRKADLRRSVRGGVVAGCFLFSGYILQTFGLKYTTAAKAGFITGLYIPLVPLIGAVIYRKVPQTSEVLGIAAAFIGMAFMTIESSALKIGTGDLLVTACAVVYAFHILILGRFAPGSNVGVLTVTQIATGSVLGGATCWWVEPARVRWTATVWIALGVTSLLATALAFYLQTWAQQYSSPTRTALIFSLEPVFAWLASFLLTGEVLSGRGVAGAALILAGILLVELKPLRIGQHQWS
jgi:drug/metabolite transporter (DMT)-like permease